MTRLHKFLLPLLLILLASCARHNLPQPLHAIDVSWQVPNADFRLADANGKMHTLEDFDRNKVVALFFGYTHCPEVCPTTMADLAQAMRELGADASKVQVLFVTLDPERDTAAKLRQFVPAFDASFIGLRGEAQATAQAAKAFHINYEKHYAKDGSYTLDHSDGTYLIGMGGKPIWKSRYGQRTDYLVADIKRLIAAGH